MKSIKIFSIASLFILALGAIAVATNKDIQKEGIAPLSLALNIPELKLPSLFSGLAFVEVIWS